MFELRRLSATSCKARGGELTLLQRQEWDGFLEVHPDLRVVDLRVVYVHKSVLGQEVADESYGCRLARVTSVSLEREAQDSNSLERKQAMS